MTALELELRVPDGLPIWAIEVLHHAAQMMTEAAALKGAGHKRSGTLMANSSMNLMGIPSFRAVCPKVPTELASMHYQITED